MRWRIYYADGSTFSHLDGAPEDAPGFGVIAVAQADEVVGVQIHHGKDFYVYDVPRYGGWYNVDAFGLAQYLGVPGVKIVKLADVMPTEQYRALIASLHADPALPPKSARYEWERADG